MGKIDMNQIELSQEDAIMVLQSFGIRVNSKKQMLCPFHNDRHIGNCGFIKNAPLIHCFACGNTWSVFDVAMHMEGVDYYDAVRMVWHDILGRQLPEEPNERKINFRDLAFIGLGGRKPCVCYKNLYHMEEARKKENEKKYLRKVEIPYDYLNGDIDLGNRKNPQTEEIDTFLMRVEVAYEKPPSIWELEPKVREELVLGKAKEKRDILIQQLNILDDQNSEIGRIAMTDPDYANDIRIDLLAQIDRCKSIMAKIS